MMIKIYLRALIFAYTDLINQFRYYLLKSRWRQLNLHNSTVLGFSTDINKITVGNSTYGSLNVYEFGILGERLFIGNYVSIARNVNFILGGNHKMDTFTSYPLKAMLTFRDFDQDAESKGPIIVEDECWIGFNVTILSGVTIGRGAIIAAGSVVTKDVLPFSIVGGNPAKIIKFKHNEEIISYLKTVSLSNMSEELIIKNIEIFYEPLESSIGKIQKMNNERLNNNS